jgi:hypothetical protein
MWMRNKVCLLSFNSVAAAKLNGLCGHLRSQLFHLLSCELYLLVVCCDFCRICSEGLTIKKLLIWYRVSGRSTRINQCKRAFIAQLPYLPVRESMAVMWHLWLVLKLEECGEDFQILETASLQILRDYSHGQDPTLRADSFLASTVTKYYNECIFGHPHDFVTLEFHTTN